MQPMVPVFRLDSGATPDSIPGLSLTRNECRPEASIDLVLFLLDRRADAKPSDKHGFTPAHRIAASEQLDLLSLLLDRGPSPNPAAEGRTPRSLADGQEKTEIVALLDDAIASACLR